MSTTHETNNKARVNLYVMCHSVIAVAVGRELYGVTRKYQICITSNGNIYVML